MFGYETKTFQICYPFCLREMKMMVPLPFLRAHKERGRAVSLTPTRSQYLIKDLCLVAKLNHGIFWNFWERKWSACGVNNCGFHRCKNFWPLDSRFGVVWFNTGFLHSLLRVLGEFWFGSSCQKNFSECLSILFHFEGSKTKEGQRFMKVAASNYQHEFEINSRRESLDAQLANTIVRVVFEDSGLLHVRENCQTFEVDHQHQHFCNTKKILRGINFVKITKNIFQRWSRIWPLLFGFCAISTPQRIPVKITNKKYQKNGRGINL